MSEKPKKKAKKVVKAKKTVAPKKVAESKKSVKKPFDYKTTIWVGLALVALILVVIAILKFNQNEKFDTSYFHNTDGKIVLTMDKDSAALDDSEWEPYVTHVVYYHDGGKIIAARAFYEYFNEAEAEEAYKHLELGNFADSKKVNGKYVVFDINKTRFEELTVEDLEHSVELLKGIDALVLNYDDEYVKTHIFELPKNNE